MGLFFADYPYETMEEEAACRSTMPSATMHTKFGRDNARRLFLHHHLTDTTDTGGMLLAVAAMAASCSIVVNSCADRNVGSESRNRPRHIPVAAL